MTSKPRRSFPVALIDMLDYLFINTPVLGRHIAQPAILFQLVKLIRNLLVDICIYRMLSMHVHFTVRVKYRRGAARALSAGAVTPRRSPLEPLVGPLSLFCVIVGIIRLQVEIPQLLCQFD